jgi:hypothetical protein
VDLRRARSSEDPRRDLVDQLQEQLAPFDVPIALETTASAITWDDDA